METQNPELVLKSIYELKGLNFFVPSYQRGYRWSQKQVTDLLEDIKAYSKEQKDDYYCLQPLVVKQATGVASKLTYRVIDGQQRLTTIHIIFSYLNSLKSEKAQRKYYTLDYETRTGSSDFLASISKESSRVNIDYYHIWCAHEIIEHWFDINQNLEGKIEDILLNHVKFIWYELGSNEDEKDVFTRLNAGKIPLSSAELIKALILNKKEFTSKEGKFDALRQSQVGMEWDIIEKELQNDSLWYFITGGAHDYTSRIEYLFHLRHGHETKTNDSLSTFLAVNNKVEEGYTTRDLWGDLKNDYMKICEWYEDHNLYHLLGYWFAINKGTNTKQVKEMLELSGNNTKQAFLDLVKESIIERIGLEGLDELRYDMGQKSRILNVLLLFNIQTILLNESKEYRFPFDLFLNPAHKWDIEHIRSISSDEINKIDSVWADRMREFLNAVYGTTTTDHYVRFEGEDIPMNKLSAKITEVIKEKEAAETKRVNRFRALVLAVNEKLEGKLEPSTLHSLGNLALLDASTNRSYKNLPFAVKRYIVFEKDSKVKFVPPCTRNVFAKQYTPNPVGYSSWTEVDAKSYLDHITETLLTITEPIAQ